MFQWLSPHEALAIFQALEPFAVGLRIEDPFPQDRPELWQRVRQVSPVPLIWHARRLADLRRALQERCADDFNCTGGLGEFRTLAHAVEVAGHSCWQGSSIEMGVAQVARLHAAAAARACVLPCDFVSGLVRQHTLISWDWPYKDSYLPLPSGPGLGIELDREAVRFYRQAEAEYGL
jgi:muconate cycloisomerase